MKVYIAQLKCPNNHCVMALAGEYPSFEAAEILGREVMIMFRDLIKRGTLNNECGLCHSSQLHVEVGATKYRTMLEAMPWLREEEKKQTASARAIRDSRN
jgi:hypothetical protein